VEAGGAAMNERLDMAFIACIILGVIIGVFLIVGTAYFFGCHAAIGDESFLLPGEIINTTIYVHTGESLADGRTYPTEKLPILSGAGNYTIAAQTTYPDESASICHMAEYVSYRQDRFGNHSDIYTRGWPGVVNSNCNNYLGTTDDNNVIKTNFVVGSDEVNSWLEVAVAQSDMEYAPDSGTVKIVVTRLP
jgi:hypothetical protein